MKCQYRSTVTAADWAAAPAACQCRRERRIMIRVGDYKIGAQPEAGQVWQESEARTGAGPVS